MRARAYLLRMTPNLPLIDPFARPITYLRVSVTDRCDFRCTYCMSEHMQFLPKRDLLTLEELDRLCSVFIRRGVRKLRITGGEPLVQSETNGRIVNPANGKSAKVRLIPLGGAGGGSQVSLPALQLIGVSLTDLPTIEVYSG